MERNTQNKFFLLVGYIHQCDCKACTRQQCNVVCNTTWQTAVPSASKRLLRLHPPECKRKPRLNELKHAALSMIPLQCKRGLNTFPRSALLGPSVNQPSWWTAGMLWWWTGALHDTTGNSTFFTHLQLMWTTVELNIAVELMCKNSFYDCVGVKFQKWNLKILILIRKLE